jgi:hypothetical protein
MLDDHLKKYVIRVGKIIPIATVVIGDKPVAIAQSTQQVQQPPPPNQIDPIAAFGYVIAITVTGFAFLPKVLEKWFSGAIATKEKKESIEIQQDKERADFYLKEADKKSVLFDEVFKRMLDNVLEGADESKEVYKGIMGTIEDLAEKISTLEQNQTSATDQSQRSFTSLVARINDVTSLLKERDRNSG